MTFAYLERRVDCVFVMQTTSTARVVAVDWGTTSLRAWLMGDDGQILAAHRRAKGLLSITDLPPAERGAEYEAIFTELCADWFRAHPGLPAIACGMVGSSEGWTDAGYLTVPTELSIGLNDLTEIRHNHGVLHLVPGLRVASGAEHPGDLLRGEESQLAGALDLIGPDHGGLTFVLPGTHTKWVRVDDGAVTAFTTVMTGEIYGLLLEHGLLARTAAPRIHDDHAFARGLGTTGERGLPAELFATRALVLDGLLAPSSVSDYISGVLIADEIRHQLPRHGGTDGYVLCGAPDLCERYARALELHGAAPRILAEDTTARGLWTIAARAGLIDDECTAAAGGFPT
ncbi:2-dehydro-3-deoxygalactonokinase [Mycobacterium sp. C31M]